MLHDLYAPIDEDLAHQVCSDVFSLRWAHGARTLSELLALGVSEAMQQQAEALKACAAEGLLLPSLQARFDGRSARGVGEVSALVWQPLSGSFFVFF